MKQQPELWKYQNQWYIRTQSSSFRFLARIYSDEQRQKINELINDGYIPLRTTVGKANCTKKHWNLEPFSNPRIGEGYRMISSYPKSHNFNSITYFIKQAI